MNIFKLFKSVPSLDVDLMNITKDFLSRLNIKNIDSVQCYILKDKKIVMLNYYFSNEWGSGVKLIFNVVDNKLKFDKIGKFGWRDEKYQTEDNQKVLDFFILDIQKYDFEL